MIKPKETQFIEYYHGKSVIRGILIPEIVGNESIFIVRFKGKLHFIHIIGEKLGSGHKIGYYCTPTGVPLPETKEDYRVLNKIKIENSDILEELLLLASHQAGFNMVKSFFGKLLP